MLLIPNTPLMASAAEPEEQWLDTPEPQPRLGWYKDSRTGRIYFSKTSKRSPKRKFGSTVPRPQKVQWQREDDRAYYEAIYGWSSCWFCRYCSCCCQCHGEQKWIDDDDAGVAKEAAAQQAAAQQAPSETQTQQQQQQEDGWQTAN